MKTFPRVLVALALVAACGGGGAGSPNDPGASQSGSSPSASPTDNAPNRPGSATTGDFGPAADIQLLDSTGAGVKLASTWAAQAAVIVFYRGHWWPWCRKQLGQLQGKLAQIEAAGAKLVAISVDSVSKNAALRDKLKLGYPLLSDPTHEGIKAWKVYDDDHEIARPATFVVAKGGTIIYRYVGKNQRDRPAAEVVLEVLRKPR